METFFLKNMFVHILSFDLILHFTFELNILQFFNFPFIENMCVENGGRKGRKYFLSFLSTSNI